MKEARRKEIALMLSKRASAAAASPGLITRLLTKITGAPVKGVGEGLARLTAGGKEHFGVHKGKRLQYAGRSNISAQEYAKIKELAKRQGGVPGEVPGIGAIHKVKGPHGQTAYQKDQYRPGGLVGFAMKHPIITGLGGFIGYKALTRPSYPAPAGPRAAPQQAPQQPVNPNPWG